MRIFFSFSLVLFLSITAVLFCTSCANIIPPSGGPRDTIPPRLLFANPKDSTLNFRGNKISFSFDEYIDLQDVQNNLLFTPLFEQNPRVDVKGKTITVNFQDTLEPRTTYIFKFGNSIKDFNEGNILRNFTYTFSTGSALDSLELRGRVILAQTGKIDSNLVVVLHKNLKDSAVMNQRPQYATRLDSNGNFRFQNLPAGTFAVYAIGDAGISRRYQTKNQMFAFLDHPVVVGEKDSVFTLYAYKEMQQTAASSAYTGGRGPARGENRLIFSTNLTGNKLELDKDLAINFTVPLKQLDSSKLLLSTDTVFTPIAFTTLLDSSRKELSLHADWKEGTSYNLIMDKDFATDTSGRHLLKTDTLFFATKKLSDYGNITIRFKDLDLDKKMVLLFIQNEQTVFSAPLKTAIFTKEKLMPGEYELRILYDDNDNGKWDAGQFFGTKKQPERVINIKEKIAIKPGVDNTFNR